MFSAEFAQTCEEVDAFVGEGLRYAGLSLGLEGFHGSPAQLAAQRSFLNSRQEVLRWLLQAMVLYGLAQEEGGHFAVGPLGPPLDLEEVFRQRVAKTPQAMPALAVLKLAFLQLPAILAGTSTGEEALFCLENLPLWFAYFANTNLHYAPSNALAALALARAVPQEARILELGGGGGSAAEAALSALEQAGKKVSQYVFTELHPAFLRRGLRLVREKAPKGCEVEGRSYDINLPPQAQGLEGQFHAILAVNVLHLARDLVSCLRSLASLLLPGGVLVLGELLRPGPQTPVHLELPFLLLESYRLTGQDALRPQPGFLHLEGWRQALEVAGYALVSLLPAQLPRCQEAYPGFYCAALTARPQG
jgi:SAM-dependent methyltransferase